MIIQTANHVAVVQIKSHATVKLWSSKRNVAKRKSKSTELQFWAEVRAVKGEQVDEFELTGWLQ